VLVLVTGGAGFIGSHVVDVLLDDGHEVRVLDLKLSANAQVDMRRGDVRDAETVRSALQGVEAVCHQAAQVGLEQGVVDAPSYASHNDVGTAVLLAQLAETKFSGRVVLASSMVVYGEGRYVCEAHGPVAAPPRHAADLAARQFEPKCPRCDELLRPLPVPEDAPVDPRNIYAATKLHQEHLLFAYSRQQSVQAVALRYHNVYGPRMPRDTPYAGVAALFMDAMARGEAAQVFEDGRQLRDFVHVRDVARANLRALHPQGPVGAFNVCSGKPRSVGEMAETLHAAVPDAPPPVTTGYFRLGDVRHVFADHGLARDQLAFVAQEDFEQGMQELAAFLAADG
jgi:dTDP-L-rhamnose 4-epimerase